MECVGVLMVAILVFNVAECITPQSNDFNYLTGSREFWNLKASSLLVRKKRELVLGCCGSGFDLSGGRKDLLQQCFPDPSNDTTTQPSVIVNPELNEINCALQCYGDKLHLTDENGYLKDLTAVKEILKGHFNKYNIKRIVKQHAKVCMTYGNIAGAAKEIDDQHAKSCNKATARLFSCLLTAVHAMCPKSSLKDSEECKNDRQNAKHMLREFMIEIGL